MSSIDSRDCAVSGATPAALQAFESALDSVLAWRHGTNEALSRATAEAPDFAMPLILQAHTMLCSRDPGLVRSARSIWERAMRLSVNAREAAHLKAIASVLADDYDAARRALGALLQKHPHDVLALHVAHALDHLSGDTERLVGRPAEVVPRWTREMPGYQAVLSMYAFGLVETGELAEAETVALAVLRADRRNARAHHVMAHVFEMSQRTAEGIRWMEEHRSDWTSDSSAATHCWWHLALFLIDAGRPAEALAIHDERLRGAGPGAVGELIDASALLWRLVLRGHDVGARWNRLSEAWAPRIDDAFCSFSDLHAMLAFVGARDWKSATRLEHGLEIQASSPTRHGGTTRMLGLPACRAVMAYGQGDNTRAIRLLAGLPPLAHRLGGSHAQRDVLHLTLMQAVERTRRPAPPVDIAGRSFDLPEHSLLGRAVRRLSLRNSSRRTSQRPPGHAALGD